jgi:neutral amino acid transport system ATP-binding protein
MNAETHDRIAEATPGSAKPDAVLVADKVSRAFGGVHAVDLDHLEVQRHTVTSLIGPNGAGKTTLFNLLTGFDDPETGTWSLDGVDLSGRSPHEIARAGMVRTFQLTRTLSRLSVLDNMLVGAKGNPGERLKGALLGGWRSTEDQNTERAHNLLDRFSLTQVTNDFAGSLSGGQRKLLEMARALMVEPTIVMLDEPMAGVNPALTQSLLGHITSLRDEGLTVVFVEHDMDVIQEISDWVVVLAEGKVISEGTPDDISHDPEVIDAYLGKHHGEAAS